MEDGVKSFLKQDKYFIHTNTVYLEQGASVSNFIAILPENPVTTMVHYYKGKPETGGKKKITNGGSISATFHFLQL